MSELGVDRDLPATYEWVKRTGGSLSVSQRRAIRRGIRSGYGDLARGITIGSFRRSRASSELPSAPDSKLARTAAEAADEQTPALRGHSYRTWLIGAALADHDRASIDAELLYITSLLHDSGLMTAVAGQDFTVRSAENLIAVCDKAGEPDRGVPAADAAVSHATPGLGFDDNPVGFYVQAGAMADLAGLRFWDLPRGYLGRSYGAYPACGVHTEVPQLIRREAHDVPEGRFAMLRSSGVDRMVSISPTRRFARAAG